METTIVYWGYRENGKENGNYYSTIVYIYWGYSTGVLNTQRL